MLTINQIPTYLGWSFTRILPGTFKRNRPEFMHHDYPILAPLPTNGAKQQPLEGASVSGPFIYFVQDDHSKVFYVGKSKEKQVLKRWIRPDDGTPAKHYWTHSTRTGGCVFNIAKGLRAGEGPYHLRFTSLSALSARFAALLELDHLMDEDKALKRAEHGMILALDPAWNQP